jgi:hypothetical protein
MGDLGADRSHQQALESAGPAGTDDEQVGVGGRLEERLGGQAGDGPDGDRRGPGFGADLLECAGRLFLGRLAAVLGQVLVARVEDGAAPVSDHSLLDGEDGERCVADRRFPDGPLKGEAGVVRSVGPTMIPVILLIS